MNRRSHHYCLGLLAGSLLVASGCINLDPQVDPTRFFVLSPIGESEASPPSDLALGLGPVVIPNYLQSNWMALRSQENEILYSEYHQWAERLDTGMARVIGQNLSTLLQTDKLYTAGWVRGSVQYAVFLTFQRFEANEQGRADLEATWYIADPDTRETFHFAQSRISKAGPVPSNDPNGTIKALSESLGDLSREIVAALKALPKP